MRNDRPNGSIPVIWEVLVKVSFLLNVFPLIPEFLWLGFGAIMPLPIWYILCSLCLVNNQVVRQLLSKIRFEAFGCRREEQCHFSESVVHVGKDTTMYMRVYV